MAQFKKQMKKIGRYTWEIVKASIPSMFMYLCAGVIMMMVCLKKEPASWTTSAKVWSVVCLIGAVAYNALICWAHGGSHYEMLVSGNVKRSTAEMYGAEYKISSHKIAKEYRVWKGFVIGGISALFPLITGFCFGLSFTPAAEKLNLGGLIGFLLSGWSVLPVYCMNQGGASISYFVTMLFALIPIAVSGGFYIAGAYARRNKAIRQQILADKAAEAEANKVKKINYGALPGTKPKKKRK